jgi:nucleoside 2-deoxyribosyltransferase
MLVYVAGPYSGDTDEKVESNIVSARCIGIELWEMGHSVIVPHMNTAHFEKLSDVSWERFMEGDLDILSRCDCLVLTPDWRESKGACMEKEYAESLKIPVYVYPCLPSLHPTEVARPEQAVAFREMVGQMYRVHLDKNADYSPANIMGVGQIGLGTRLWDKTTRIMNLLGFRIEIASSAFEKPLIPKCESLQDSYLDLAVYSVIGVLLMREKWGR